MDALSVVLIIKIVLTVVWSFFLLFYELSIKLGFPDPKHLGIFIRLLGMAYAALLVGYVFGLKSSLQGYTPEEIVWVGIVSNGGACLILISGALNQVWESWGKYARIALWASLFLTGAITMGLVIFGL